MKQNIISQKQIINAQNQCAAKSRKDLPKQKGNNNRHVSVLYGMQYLTRVPVLKRCRKTEIDCFGNIQKKQIFELVHGFLNKLLQNEEYLDQVIDETKFDQNQLQTKILPTDRSINSKNILKENSNDAIQDMVEISINIVEPQSKYINDDFMMPKPFENKTNLNITKSIDKKPKISIMLEGDEFDFSQHLHVSSNLKVNDKKIDKKPKISIMLQGDDFDFSQQLKSSNQQFSSALFSQQTISPGLSSVDITEQQLTMKMIELIYEQPQPFLINLSVCLMLKYLHCSSTKLSKINVCWILSIGTIIAYKIYYDEPVEGLIQSFAYILKLNKQDIITLQRHFLAQIDHEAVISSQQYHSTLYQIIKHGAQ